MSVHDILRRLVPLKRYGELYNSDIKETEDVGKYKTCLSNGNLKTLMAEFEDLDANQQTRLMLYLLWIQVNHHERTRNLSRSFNLFIPIDLYESVSATALMIDPDLSFIQKQHSNSRDLDDPVIAVAHDAFKQLMTWDGQSISTIDINMLILLATRFNSNTPYENEMLADYINNLIDKCPEQAAILKEALKNYSNHHPLLRITAFGEAKHKGAPRGLLQNSADILDEWDGETIPFLQEISLLHLAKKYHTLSEALQLKLGRYVEEFVNEFPGAFKTLRIRGCITNYDRQHPLLDAFLVGKKKANKRKIPPLISDDFIPLSLTPEPGNKGRAFGRDGDHEYNNKESMDGTYFVDDAENDGYVSEDKAKPVQTTSKIPPKPPKKKLKPDPPLPPPDQRLLTSYKSGLVGLRKWNRETIPLFTEELILKLAKNYHLLYTDQQENLIIYINKLIEQCPHQARLFRQQLTEELSSSTLFDQIAWLKEWNPTEPKCRPPREVNEIIPQEKRREKEKITEDAEIKSSIHRLLEWDGETIPVLSDARDLQLAQKYSSLKFTEQVMLQLYINKLVEKLPDVAVKLKENLMKFDPAHVLLEKTELSKLKVEVFEPSAPVVEENDDNYFMGDKIMVINDNDLSTVKKPPRKSKRRRNAQNTDFFFLEWDGITVPFIRNDQEFVLAQRFHILYTDEQEKVILYFNKLIEKCPERAKKLQKAIQKNMPTSPLLEIAAWSDEAATQTHKIDATSTKVSDNEDCVEIIEEEGEKIITIDSDDDDVLNSNLAKKPRIENDSNKKVVNLLITQMKDIASRSSTVNAPQTTNATQSTKKNKSEPNLKVRNLAQLQNYQNRFEPSSTTQTGQNDENSQSSTACKSNLKYPKFDFEQFKNSYHNRFVPATPTYDYFSQSNTQNHNSPLLASSGTTSSSQTTKVSTRPSTQTNQKIKINLKTNYSSPQTNRQNHSQPSCSSSGQSISASSHAPVNKKIKINLKNPNISRFSYQNNFVPASDQHTNVSSAHKSNIVNNYKSNASLLDGTAYADGQEEHDNYYKFVEQPECSLIDFL